jgi:hypothetical protein
MTEKEEGCGEVDEEIVEPSGGGIQAQTVESPKSPEVEQDDQCWEGLLRGVRGE